MYLSNNTNARKYTVYFVHYSQKQYKFSRVFADEYEKQLSPNELVKNNKIFQVFAVRLVNLPYKILKCFFIVQNYRVNESVPMTTVKYKARIKCEKSISSLNRRKWSRKVKAAMQVKKTMKQQVRKNF